MLDKFRIAYFAHSVRSDWNNGNAHFLRGLLREMTALGHDVNIFEPACSWSLQYLLKEKQGARSLQQFTRSYPELHVSTYGPDLPELSFWRGALRECDIVLFHEWNSPALAQQLLEIREEIGFRLLFHDTHHRAASSAEQVQLFGIDRFDGVIAFGEALRSIYASRFGINRAWTLHEAADTRVFHPCTLGTKTTDVVWIGNWGDDERSQEIRSYLLRPAATLPQYRFAVYGVRYPEQGLEALRNSAVGYHGYLPNLEAPRVYAASRITMHLPRQQYVEALEGIPTIRVFEALACGIPLISAPWKDTGHLFRRGDLLFVHSGEEMWDALQLLLENPRIAQEQANRGLRTVLSRHTCRHRAEQLTNICQEVLQ